MDKKLTFKEYMESKDQLLKAINETPIQELTYSVKKYCKLIVGESKLDKQAVSFKPSNIIKVKWLYEELDNPIPISLTFEGACGILKESEHKVYWKGDKLQEWLNKNTIAKNGI